MRSARLCTSLLGCMHDAQHVGTLHSRSLPLRLLSSFLPPPDGPAHTHTRPRCMPPLSFIFLLVAESRAGRCAPYLHFSDWTRLGSSPPSRKSLSFHFLVRLLPAARLRVDLCARSRRRHFGHPNDDRHSTAVRRGICGTLRTGALSLSL